MKRRLGFLAGLLAVLMLFPLAGCNAGNNMEGMDDMNDGANNMYPTYNDPVGAAPNEETLPGNEESGEGAVVDNPFIATNEQNVSTFSADVDTASYTYFRKLVANSRYSWESLKRLGGSFRTEEFVNYFRYDAKTPGEGELFGVESRIVPCPWNGNTVLMRMTLQAAVPENNAGNNLVFLIDVSGSMQSSDKLALLKKAFSYLTDSLTANDVISIVTYSGNERVVLEGCRGDDSQQILSAIRSLSAYGSTNGEAGLTRAYEIAERYRIEGGNNRIIMASDGDLNVGISSQGELTQFVTQKRQTGIYLSVLGFGTGNYRDSKMEALADNGNGVYYYIDGMSEAEKVFGSDLLG
ncbi:MAG: von Willebrand factor type A domain-containing protein, partial [Clostridia bacterium]|nr:von Willebrand factor type A domain-containing protein [Clostridia bacterium]